MDDLVSWTLTKMSIIFFLFFLLAMSEFIHMSEVVNPTGQGSPPPFFLGVAIGLELRIRL